MNKYEILLIFKPSFEAESMDTLLAQVETTLTAAGGNILRSERFGRKKLAYRIQKLREGLMAVVAVELPPTAIKDLTFNLKLNEELIRFLILRNEDLDPEKPFLVTPVTGREPREAGGRGGRGGPGGRFGGREGGGGGGRFGDREGGGGGGGRFGDREGGGGGGYRGGGGAPREGGFQGGSGGPGRFGPPREGGYTRPEQAPATQAAE